MLLTASNKEHSLDGLTRVVDEYSSLNVPAY